MGMANPRKTPCKDDTQEHDTPQSGESNKEEVPTLQLANRLPGFEHDIALEHNYCVKGLLYSNDNIVVIGEPIVKYNGKIKLVIDLRKIQK